MIRLQRPYMFLFLCCVTVFLMPFLFSGINAVDDGSAGLVGVILLFSEVAAYALWIGLFTRFNMILLTAVPVGLAILRLLLAVAGGVYVNAVGSGDGGDVIMKFWFGLPLAVILQVVVFIYALPYLLAMIAPGVLADTSLEDIVGGDEPEPASAPPAPAARERSTDITPAGGLLQIYTLEDIPKYFDKVAGLEGFAIYTSEGLLFCHDLPQDQQVERLGVRLQNSLTAMQLMAVDCELEAPKRVILETENFTMFLSTITPHFWGIFIFNKNVPLDNCHLKIKLLADSAKQFFSSRYVLS